MTPPSSEPAEGSTSVAAGSSPMELTQALKTVTAAGKSAYADVSNIPTPFSGHKRWVPEVAEDAPHDPHSYFPMLLVK